MRTNRQLFTTSFWALLALALLVRLAAALVLSIGRPYELFEYGVVARVLLDHGFYGFDFYGYTPARPDAFIPPLYPLLVALTLLLAPTWPMLLLALIQCGISLWGCWLSYSLAEELWNDRRISLLALLITALHVPFVAYVGLGATGLFDVVLLQAAITYGIRGLRRGSFALVALAGFWVGLATLTRTPALLILPALLAGLALTAHPWRQRLLLGGTLVAVALLCLLPWVVRNQVLYHALVLSTNGGFNFYIGNGPAATGEFVAPPPALMQQAAALPDVARDQLFYAEALAHIRSNPAAWLGVLANKGYQLVWFRPNLGTAYSQLGPIVASGPLPYKLSYALLLVLALPSLWHTRHHWRLLLPLYLAALAYGAVCLAFFVATRYRTPIEALLVPFAALTLGRVTAARRPETRDPRHES